MKERHLKMQNFAELRSYHLLTFRGLSRETAPRSPGRSDHDDLRVRDSLPTTFGGPTGTVQFQKTRRA